MALTFVQKFSNPITSSPLQSEAETLSLTRNALIRLYGDAALAGAFGAYFGAVSAAPLDPYPEPP